MRTKKITRKALSIMLALIILAGLAPLATPTALAAPGDVTAKAITLIGAAGENKAGNLETDASIYFDGSWPGTGWTAVSIGLIPAGTAMIESAINSAFIGLDTDEPFSGSIASNLMIFGVDLTSWWQGPIAPGQYRVVVYATPPGGDWEDEEIFYSADTVEIIAGSGYVYDLSATTIMVTDGGEIGQPTRLAIHLDLGLTSGETATLMPYDRIYLDFVNFTAMADPIDLRDAVLTSPSAFSFVDMGVPPGVTQAMIGMSPGATYTVSPFGLDFIIDGAIPLEEYATVIVKMVREPEPPGMFASLGHWESTISFTGSSNDTGLHSARMLCSLGADGDILTSAPYHLYAYSKRALTVGDTATAALHYTGADASAYTISTTLTTAQAGDFAFYAKADWPSALASPIARVDSVDFTFDGDTIIYPVNKNAACSALVTYTGSQIEEYTKYLKVKDSAGATVNNIFIGSTLPADGTVVSGLTAGLQYTFEVYGNQNGRAVVYGSDMLTPGAGANALELGIAPKSATRITPSIGLAPDVSLFGFAFSPGIPASIYWYDAPVGGKRLSSSKYYDLYEGESVYVEAVPFDWFDLFVRPSIRIQVQASDPNPVLQLQALLYRYTIAGSVKLSDGTPATGVDVLWSTFSPSEGHAHTQYTKTDMYGNFSCTTTELTKVTMTISRLDLETVTLSGLDSMAYGALEITMNERQYGLIDASTNESIPRVYSGPGSSWGRLGWWVTGAFQYCVHSITSGGEDVAFSISDKWIVLDEPTEQEVILHMEADTQNPGKSNWYADIPITLDGNNRGSAPRSFSYTRRYPVSFDLLNAVKGAHYRSLIYDASGNLVQNNLFLADSPTPNEFIYLRDGRYTAVFMRNKTYQSINDPTGKSLNQIKASIATLGDLYTEQDIAVDGTEQAFAVGLPVGAPPVSILNLEASSLHLEADSELISVRAVIALINPDTAPECVTVELATNQALKNESGELNYGGNTYILNGSVYINGHSAGAEIELHPNDTPSSGGFNGAYLITIPDVSKYGGFPLTLRWQSYRINLDDITAIASCIVGPESYWFGEKSLGQPAFSLTVPPAIGSTDFYVYGYAPKGSAVSISVDGAVAASAIASEKNGFYCTNLSLSQPIGPQIYFVGAVAVTPDGNTLSVQPKTINYNSNLPALADIMITNWHMEWNTVWREGQAGLYRAYLYAVGRPMYWRLTFRNATGPADLEDVYVNIPQTDGSIKRLEALWDSRGYWQTEYYLCGNNPPTGVWVEYQAVERAPVLSGAEYANLHDVLDTYALTTTEQRQKAEAELAGSGLTVNSWSAGGIIEDAVFALSGGASGQFSITRSESTGAAAEVASWPVLPTGAALDSAEAAGMVFHSGDLMPYACIGRENGVLTTDIVYKISAAGGAICKRDIITMNRYERIYCDTAANKVERLVYTRVGGDLPEPAGHTSAAFRSMLDAWQPFFSGLAEIAQPGLSGALQGSGAVMDMDDATTSHSALTQKASTMGTMAYSNNNSADITMLASENRDCACGTGCRCGMLPIQPAMPEGSYNPVIAFYEALDNYLTRVGGGLFIATPQGKNRNLQQYVQDKRDLARLGQFMSIPVTSLCTGPSRTAGQYLLGQVVGTGAELAFHNSLAYAKKEEMRADALDVYIAAYKAGLSMDYFPWVEGLPYKAKNCGCLFAKDDPEVPNPPEPEKPKKTPVKVIQPPVPVAILDPSGYVYEAVYSNRVEGAVATVYEVDSMDGTMSPWVADEYSQHNPQMTDEHGYYEWFVPPGGWAVTVQKAGYEDFTTTSHQEIGSDTRLAEDGVTWYLPVAPEQLDVNIALTSNVAPYVESAARTTEGIYIVFSKYMDESTLAADNFLVNAYESGSASEQPLALTIRLLDSEEGVGGLNYSRSILLEYAMPENTAQLDLTIGANVSSYAGVEMNAGVIYTDMPLTNLLRAETPIADVAAGEVPINTSVALSTATDNALIYYTTDGSVPTRSNGKLYTGAIVIVNTTTIKAVTVKAGMKDSEVMTAVYSVTLKSEPDFPDNPSGDGGTTPQKPGGGGGTGTTGGGASDDIDDPETPLAGPWENPYSDVADTDWFYDAVRFATERSLMNGTGDGKFSPGATVTRAMIVTVLYRLEGEPAVSGKLPFPDVKAGEWYSDAILWAFRNEITLGYDDGNFGPDDPLTREQTVVILYRYAKARGLDVGAAAELGKFADAGNVSDWALDALKWAVAEGIIEGRAADRLAPQGSSTRAEIATILKRFIEGLEQT